jgi:hypothetical protein
MSAVAAVMSRKEPATTLDPDTCVGLAPLIVDRVLARVRTSGWLERSAKAATRILSRCRRFCRRPWSVPTVRGQVVTGCTGSDGDGPVLACNGHRLQQVILLGSGTLQRSIERWGDP